MPEAREPPESIRCLSASTGALLPETVMLMLLG
jgi:hypothetical protein